MGKSMDFSDGIKIIREAHSDAEAILEKWRDLISARGEVTLSIKRADGTVSDITLPTIREAINRYLGGTFEQINLTDGRSTVVIRLNERGDVEIVDVADSPANLIAGRVLAGRVVGANGALPIAGNVSIQGGSIQNAYIRQIKASGGTISSANFTGTVTLAGGSRISGSLTVNNVSASALDIGKIQYRRQVIRFGAEYAISQALEGSTDGNIWTGDVSVLEAAGIYAEPTWADCTTIPETLIMTGSKIHIYWGAPGEEDLLISGISGSYDFNASAMAMWPYKMYEQVDGGYRIRWLPLTDLAGRIHYVRTGNSGSGMTYNHVEVVSSATGREVHASTIEFVKKYSCRRFMADHSEEIATLSTISHHILYNV